MHLKPRKQWYCDACGLLIEQPDHGLLERQTGDLGIPVFRIVHADAYARRTVLGEYLPAHPKALCRHADAECFRLDELARIRKVDRLLRKIGLDDPDLPEAAEYDLEDHRPEVELIRRLTIPRYEEARALWDEARRNGFFELFIELHGGELVIDEFFMKEMIFVYTPAGPSRPTPPRVSRKIGPRSRGRVRGKARGVRPVYWG